MKPNFSNSTIKSSLTSAKKEYDTNDSINVAVQSGSYKAVMWTNCPVTIAELKKAHPDRNIDSMTLDQLLTIYCDENKSSLGISIQRKMGEGQYDVNVQDIRLFPNVDALETGSSLDQGSLEEDIMKAASEEPPFDDPFPHTEDKIEGFDL
tara:strand:+ start:735 stop:1187 length:453 start_codon:yes stop_codon:yes gene_type:complete